MPDFVEHAAAASICTVLWRAGSHHAAGSVTRLPLFEVSEGDDVDECSCKLAMTRKRVLLVLMEIN